MLPIDSPLTKCFCIVNIRLERLETARLCRSTVVYSYRSPQRIVVYLGFEKRWIHSQCLLGSILWGSEGRRNRSRQYLISLVTLGYRSERWRWDNGGSRWWVVKIKWVEFLVCIGCKLSSQTTVDVSHGVEAGASGTHLHGDLPHRMELLLHAALLKGFLLICKYPWAHSLIKYFQKGYVILDAFEVFVDAHPG